MSTVNIHQAKTHFSKLIDAALHGEEVIIAKSGKPVVRLVPVVPTKLKRKPGSLKGRIKIANDFDGPLSDDVLNDFEGN